MSMDSDPILSNSAASGLSGTSSGSCRKSRNSKLENMKRQFLQKHTVRSPITSADSEYDQNPTSPRKETYASANIFRQVCLIQ